MTRALGLAAVALAVSVGVLLSLCGCSGSRTAQPPTTTQAKQVAGLPWVDASSAVGVKCRATARAVGYPVPCPTRLLAGLGPEVIGVSGVGRGTKSWRGWVFGSGDTNDQHLAMTASPRPLTNYAKLVNGPAWYPKARVRPLGWVLINGRRMRSVYVPPASNDGSAFMHHVVLIWTESGHTYGIGFHNTKGIRQTLRLNGELAKHIKLLRP